MLEPLILLTVLNCVFMFSSTMTTCALWWQYRNHRCCFRTDIDSPSKTDVRKSKTNSRYRSAKPIRKLKSDGSIEINPKISQNHETKKKKISKSKKPHLTDVVKKDIREKSTLSEASQTTRELRSPVVMEYSTIQKIVKLVNDVSEIDSASIQNIMQKNDPVDCDKKVNFNVNFNKC